MQKYSEIQEAKKGISEVNDKLAEGWELIQCVALPHAVLYIMGKPVVAGIPDAGRSDKKK